MLQDPTMVGKTKEQQKIVLKNMREEETKDAWKIAGGGLFVSALILLAAHWQEVQAFFYH